MKKGNKPERRLFPYLLLSTWLVFAILGGMFIPSFLASLPIFKIKELTIEGSENINSETLKKSIEETRLALLGINKSDLLISLQKYTGDAVKDVVIDRSFSISGLKLKVTVKERHPIAAIQFNRKVFYIDEEGTIFKSAGKKTDKLVSVYISDLKLASMYIPEIIKRFTANNLKPKEITVFEDRVSVKLSGREIILPPLELMNEEVYKRLDLIYNLKGRRIDLRFNRFILVRN